MDQCPLGDVLLAPQMHSSHCRPCRIGAPRLVPDTPRADAVIPSRFGFSPVAGNSGLRLRAAAAETVDSHAYCAVKSTVALRNNFFGNFHLKSLSCEAPHTDVH